MTVVHTTGAGMGEGVWGEGDWHITGYLIFVHNRSYEDMLIWRIFSLGSPVYDG